MNERQASILSYIEKKGEAQNKELKELIGECSGMTLWRDLTKLEQLGHIKRTRGGATSTMHYEPGREESFTLRVIQNKKSKNEIAKIAAPLINVNHAQFLDAGSTVYTLARTLTGDNYTIITSAVNTAAELAKGANNVTLLGGQVNNNTISNSGPQAEEMLDIMNIDVAIMSTSGYSVGGAFTGGYLPEAQLKKKVLKKSAFAIMLMDSDKIARSHPFTFATLEDIDVLVGDSDLPNDFINEAKNRRVCVFHPRDGYTASERQEICEELFANKHRLD